MRSRVVSADARKTVLYAREFLNGLAAAKVLGCGKHFPGLGEGSVDSHQELPIIEKSPTNLWEEDLLPYRLLRRQLPFVMVAHAGYPQVMNDKKPASLSAVWIQQTLRRRIGYRGLIVSDDLEMGGVLSAYSIAEAGVEFIRSGGDLCLVCHHENSVMEVYEGLVKAAERDRKFAGSIQRATRRAGAFKRKSARALASQKTPPSPSSVEKLSRGLWEFGEQVRLAALDDANESKRVSRRGT
jgi:beta-N-acetylhexosaminidase